MNLLPLTFFFPLLGFLLLIAGRYRLGERNAALIGVGSIGLSALTAAWVIVDFLQNGSGKTIVAPFSVRPRPGATVSTPLVWSEVTVRLDPARFTIISVPDRVARHGDPMRAVLDTAVDVGAVLAALTERLRS